MVAHYGLKDVRKLLNSKKIRTSDQNIFGGANKNTNGPLLPKIEANFFLDHQRPLWMHK